MEDESEASFVAMMIARLHSIGAKDLKPVPYKDIAVLYRANYISRIFEKELVKQKIPYRILGGIRFFERKEIKDILAYLFLLRKPDPDDPAFMSQDLYLERIINVPSRKIGPKFMDTLRKESQDRGLSMLDVLRDPKPSMRPGPDPLSMCSTAFRRAMKSTVCSVWSTRSSKRPAIRNRWRWMKSKSACRTSVRSRAILPPPIPTTRPSPSMNT
ncbi:3'-5' exonuclease [Allobaculum sp. Allo2]|uniref:3'-5' exonuclease n=1 Tax=Allobaculum sp. Allo2 TaxID=2853432 RepID=UPI001F6014D9|nr:3'-5' exonuclease [Allobaculum sp. Allo2]UNT94579.1 hypothetical protein KWG61_05635 [Allobaculum sp. Allo2]